MQAADPEALQKALNEQGRLLSRHQHVLAGVTQSLEALAHQQSEQQTQLALLVTSVKESRQSPKFNGALECCFSS